MPELCPICNREIDLLSHCKFCGKKFCLSHLQPETHSCEGLDKWKQEKLGTDTGAGRKNIQYEYKEETSKGYFPKIFKIKKSFEAEELARKKLSEKYGNRIKGYERFECKKDENNWIIEGVVKVWRIIGTKKVSFRMTIDAVSGKFIESNFF